MYSTLVEMFDKRVQASPDAIAQYGKDEKGLFYPISYKELQERVRSLALALREFGIRRGDKVGIISDNRPEWLASDLAILSLGAADVPRGRDAMPYEVEHILKTTDAEIVFAENNEQLDKILGIRKSLSKLKKIILIEGKIPEQEDIEVIHYSSLLEKGRALASVSDHDWTDYGSSDDIATVIFTSGTTGLPKGVMLSHGSMLYQLGEIDKIIDFKPGWKWLSVLPVWHAFERILQYAALYETNAIAYSKPIGKILMTDIQRINPEILPSVPRIWETVKSGVYQTLKGKSPAEARAFSFFLSMAKRYRRLESIVKDRIPKYGKTFRLPMRVVSYIPYIISKGIYKIGDKAAFSQIKSKFGTSFVGGVSGGGSISKDATEFFEAIGIRILNGYGLTETGPVVGVTSYKHPVNGIMHKFEGTELKVVDKEGRTLGPGEKGELLIRGPQVMKGYYNDKARTDEIIDKDGFLHSGDLAVLDIHGDFSIVGRVKDTIVLSGGENVEPVPIEKALMESEYIETAVVVGQDKKHLGALISINEKNTELYLKANNIPYVSRTGLAALDDVRALINKEIVKYVNSERGFKAFEQISRFAITDNQFQVGRELSAKQEIKRSEIMKLYSKEIESIFN